MGAWRGEVRTLSSGSCVQSQHVETVFGQEVVELQGVDGQVGVVGFRCQVIRSVHSHSSLSFVQFQQGGQAASFQTEVGCQFHAVGDGQASFVGCACQRREESDVLRLHVQVHFGRSAQAVRQVPQFSSASQREGARQVGHEARDLHLAQVAFCSCPYYERAEGICFFETFGQVACKQHDVLLADVSLQMGRKVSCCRHFHQFPIGLRPQLDFAVRSEQVQFGYLYQGRVGKDPSAER